MTNRKARRDTTFDDHPRDLSPSGVREADPRRHRIKQERRTRRGPDPRSRLHRTPVLRTAEASPPGSLSGLRRADDVHARVSTRRREVRRGRISAGSFRLHRMPVDGMICSAPGCGELSTGDGVDGRPVCDLHFLIGTGTSAPRGIVDHMHTTPPVPDAPLPRPPAIVEIIHADRTVDVAYRVAPPTPAPMNDTAILPQNPAPGRPNRSTRRDDERRRRRRRGTGWTR